MMSIRRRTLTLIIGLMLTGLMILSAFNLHDSNHEIAEVYDAQLAQSARLLQGVLRQRDPGEADWDRLYQAFDQAMSRVGEDGVAHAARSALGDRTGTAVSPGPVADA